MTESKTTAIFRQAEMHVFMPPSFCILLSG